MKKTSKKGKDILKQKKEKGTKKSLIEKKIESELQPEDKKEDKKTEEKKVEKYNGEKIRIYSWNVNGFRAVINKNDLITFINAENPDILCINETKLDDKVLQDEGIKKNIPSSYIQYWNCCKIKGGYAGTAIFTKIKPLSCKNDLGIPEHDAEGRTITLEFDNFFLVACYVPNAGQKLDRLEYRTQKWDPDFRNYLKDLEKTKKSVILCGDLNVAHQEIDIFNPKGNKRSAGFTDEERKEFTNLLNLGFIDSFRKLYPNKIEYSYWSARSNAREENKGWRLDYFVVSEKFMDKVEDSKILKQYQGSDHCPLELIVKN